MKLESKKDVIGVALARLVLCLRGWLGAREWETIEEFDHAATLHKIDGLAEEIPCTWRDQVCRITGRVRRQSNFGHGWATEWESSQNVKEHAPLTGGECRRKGEVELP